MLRIVSELTRTHPFPLFTNFSAPSQGLTWNTDSANPLVKSWPFLLTVHSDYVDFYAALFVFCAEICQRVERA